MTRGTRVLLALTACGALLVVSTVAVAATAVYRSGTIAVEVDGDDGERVDVRVPAGLAQIAIWLTPASVLDEVLVEEVEMWLPALRAATRELERAPDFVLVEYRSPHEVVRIEKIGRKLAILVDADDASFRVALPLGMVDSVVAKLERAGTHRG